MVQPNSTLSLPPLATPRVSCVVTVDGVEHGCEIASRTEQSIRLFGVELLVLAQNKPMNIAYQGGCLDAYSAFVQRSSGGRFQLDARIDAPVSEDAPHPAMLLNCYIRLKTSVIICMPIAFEDASTARVQLWDGVQFRVPKKSLIAMTRQERIQTLTHGDQLKTACNTYGFETVDPSQAVQQVAEFEFGKSACPIAG